MLLVGHPRGKFAIPERRKLQSREPEDLDGRDVHLPGTNIASELRQMRVHGVRVINPFGV